MKPHAIWLVRPEALSLGLSLADTLNATLYQPWLATDRSALEQFRQQFHQHRHWVLVMACGIAVRYLDGLPASKLSDPGVVVLDEAARFAIPLLSGHEGGANTLAYRVAQLTGAYPAVTTASEALKPLTLGIGCRRGKSAAAIERAVLNALGDLPMEQVREVATIDLKADEAGLLDFCRENDLPLRVIARADVASRGWTQQPSAWVQHNLGVDGVCEPCALIASPRGQLIVPKTILDGVTVAIVTDSIHSKSTG